MLVTAKFILLSPVAALHLEVLQTLGQLPALPRHCLVMRDLIKIKTTTTFHMKVLAEWSKMASVGLVFLKAVSTSLLYILLHICLHSLHFHLYLLGWIKLCCDCDQYSGHVCSLIALPINCNKCSPYTTVMCFSLSKSLSNYGGLLKEKFLRFFFFQ